jgi:hypothetical protein
MGPFLKIARIVQFTLTSWCPLELEIICSYIVVKVLILTPWCPMALPAMSWVVFSFL